MTSIYFACSCTDVPHVFLERMRDLRRCLISISGARVLDPDPVGLVPADLVVAILDYEFDDLPFAVHVRRSLNKPLMLFYPLGHTEIAPWSEAKPYSSDEDIAQAVDCFVALREPGRQTQRVVC